MTPPRAGEAPEASGPQGTGEWPGARPVPGSGPAGRIEIRDLRVVGVHGVLAEERERGQPFSLDLDVWLDLGEAAASDQLSRTADYGALAELAARIVESRSFALLEALAHAVAREVLAADARVSVVAATVRKLRPPIPRDMASVGVRVVLDRSAVERAG